MFPSYDSVTSGMQANMQTLEDIRASYKQTLFTGIPALIFFAAAPLFLAFLANPVVTGVSAVIAIVGIITAIVKMVKKHQTYRTEFKRQVVTGILKQLVEGCKLPNETNQYEYRWGYDPARRVNDDQIDRCELFEDRIDEIFGEDLIYGKLGLTDFQFSELRLVKVVKTRNSKGQQRTTRQTVFDGVLFIADFHKHFKGSTILRSSGFMGTGGLFNRFKNSINNVFTSDKLYNIKLENDEFNKIFDTNTTDEIEARYILSSSFMERILKFKELHNERVEFSFVGSNMCLALHTGKNYFEPSPFQSISGVQGRKVYDDLHFFFHMIEHFDLNTRIWSK